MKNKRWFFYVFLLFYLLLTNSFALIASPFDAVMRSVFCVSGKNASGEPVFGTAFLVQENARIADSAWLLTAGHTLSHIAKDHIQLNMRRLNRGVFSSCPVLIKIRERGKPLYYVHSEHDIAAVRIALPAEADCCLLACDFIADEGMLDRFGVGAGTRIMIPGYPYGEACNEAGFSFVRNGIVSSFPMLPSKLYPVFYADFEVFAGYSGAPVICGDNSGAGFLVGMVLEEVFLEELHSRKNKKTIKNRRGLGIAKILSAPVIKSFLSMLR